MFPNDIEQYCALSKVPCGELKNVNPPAPNATVGCIEATLDVELVIAAAAGVLSVVGLNKGASFLQWALDWFDAPAAETVDIASVSWSDGGENAASVPGANASQARMNLPVQKLGVIGKSIFWASGDDGTGPPKAVPNRTGAFACDPGQPFAPTFPATSPFVTACGGTEVLAPQLPAAQAPPICSQVPGGCADTRGGRAPGVREQATSLVVSDFSSGGGFSWWFERPAWQREVVDAYLRNGTRLPTAGRWRRAGRAIPDVSSVAGNLIIVTNGEVWEGGGTSGAAPFWAGVWALATAVSRRTTGRPLGPANPLLYRMAVDRPECFHDVTVGDNRCPWNVHWEGNSCDCAQCDGFEAAIGWDPVTGLGSPNVTCILDYVAGLAAPQ